MHADIIKENNLTHTK